MDTTTNTRTAQRRHESPEIGSMIRRMIRALVDRAAEGDTEALEALAQLERDLPSATSSALAVMNLGTGPEGFPGYSFGFLADVVGTSRQAARQRAVRVLPDDKAAAYFTRGRSASLTWEA